VILEVKDLLLLLGLYCFRNRPREWDPGMDFCPM